jgi:hypothetical protein
MQSHCRLTRAHERDPLHCRHADQRWGSNKTTKQNCCSVFFSSLPIHPSFLPTYLSHPFFLPACLYTYPPTFFPTYPLFYIGQSEPIVTSLLSLYVVLMPKYFYLPTYISLFSYLFTYLSTYLPRLFFFFPTYAPFCFGQSEPRVTGLLFVYVSFHAEVFLPTYCFILAIVNQQLPTCLLCM